MLALPRRLSQSGPIVNVSAEICLGICGELRVLLFGFLQCWEVCVRAKFELNENNASVGVWNVSGIRMLSFFQEGW